MLQRQAYQETQGLGMRICPALHVARALPVRGTSRRAQASPLCTPRTQKTALDVRVDPTHQLSVGSHGVARRSKGKWGTVMSSESAARGRENRGMREPSDPKRWTPQCLPRQAADCLRSVFQLLPAQWLSRASRPRRVFQRMSQIASCKEGIGGNGVRCTAHWPHCDQFRGPRYRRREAPRGHPATQPRVLDMRTAGDVSDAKKTEAVALGANSDASL